MIAVLAGALLLTGTVLIFGSQPLHAAAGDTLLEGLDTTAEEAGFDPEGTEADATALVANFVNVLMTISGIVFLLIIVYGGFLYMTAGGQEDRIKKAKRMLVSGIIGVIIITSSFAISFYVFQKLAEATEENIGPL